VVRTRRSELLSELPARVRESWSTSSRAGEILEQVAFRSYMAVPLVARGRSFGAVALTSSSGGRQLTTVDLALAEELARRAGLAIENAELYREAQQANRLKDEFLATVSHELRTPLTAILGWLHLLRSGNPEQVTRGVDTIERNALAQARIVEDLLDVSRIVTGKLRLQLEPLQLADVVQGAIDTVRPTANAKTIELSTDFASDVQPLVGDAARLQQVVWNLLVNAIKFTPKRGTVHVSLVRQGSGVQLSVKDSGQGIRADFLPHIFQRFRQADSTSTRVHGGLGLGLAIVRHLVEAHGGQVVAESAGEGQGTTFTVLLPARPPALSERPPAP
jgi:signal transduction histidine kinase